MKMEPKSVQLSFNKFLKTYETIIPASERRFDEHVKSFESEQGNGSKGKDTFLRNSYTKRVLSCALFVLSCLSGGCVAALLVALLNRPSNSLLKAQVLSQISTKDKCDEILKAIAADLSKISKKSCHESQNYKSRLLSCLAKVLSGVKMFLYFKTTRFTTKKARHRKIGVDFSPNRGRKPATETHEHVLKNYKDHVIESTTPNPRRTRIVRENNERLEKTVRELESPLTHVIAKSGVQKPSVKGGSKSVPR